MFIPIASLAKFGVHYKCGDDVQRHLFVWVVILSSDYEEQ